LHVAVYRGYNKCIIELLKNNADILKTNNMNETPLDMKTSVIGNNKFLNSGNIYIIYFKDSIRLLSQKEKFKKEKYLQERIRLHNFIYSNYEDIKIHNLLSLKRDKLQKYHTINQNYTTL